MNEKRVKIVHRMHESVVEMERLIHEKHVKHVQMMHENALSAETEQ
jgi:hypothetical protein